MSWWLCLLKFSGFLYCNHITANHRTSYHLRTITENLFYFLAPPYSNFLLTDELWTTAGTRMGGGGGLGPVGGSSSSAAYPEMDVASLTAPWKRPLSGAQSPTSVFDLSKVSRMSLSHCGLLGLPLSLFPSIFPSKMIFPKPLLLFKWPKYFSFCFFTKFSNHWSFTLSSSLIDLFVRCSVHDWNL